jgi:hypothetical protein
MKLIVLISLFLFSLLSLAQDQYTIVGKFLELSKEDSRNLYGYRFYFVLKKSDGSKHVYPVKLRDNNKDDIKKIRKNLGEQFIIKAKPKLVEVKGKTNPERKVRIAELQVSSLKHMRLSSLGYGKMKPYQPRGVPLTQKHDVRVSSPNTVTISGVNDTFTNAAIATGAAALLGTLIFGN